MGNNDKPEEIFHIIEHFCLGRKRLHLFGNDTTVRPGERGREGGGEREGEREGGGKGGRGRERERGREGGRERGREGGREGGRNTQILKGYIMQSRTRSAYRPMKPLK